MYSEQEIVDAILKSIADVAKKAVTSAPYDRTYRGFIKSMSSGVYTVQIEGMDYQIKSSGTYAIGDTVYVLFVQNNPNNKLILGKVGA